MRIEQNMTIYSAAELKPVLLALARESEAPEFDLSAVTEIDSAGLQLLLLAKREAARMGRTIKVSHACEAVREVLNFVAFSEAPGKSTDVSAG